MLKSCKHCGRIHQREYDCGKKPQYSRHKDIDKFRSTQAWQDKREEIKQRDNYLCQICIRNLYNTVNQFTYDGLSVHHAVPMSNDYDKRLDSNNLIALCGAHHEMAESGEIPREGVLSIIWEQEHTPLPLNVRNSKSSTPTVSL